MISAVRFASNRKFDKKAKTNAQASAAEPKSQEPKAPGRVKDAVLAKADKASVQLDIMAYRFPLKPVLTALAVGSGVVGVGSFVATHPDAMGDTYYKGMVEQENDWEKEAGELKDFVARYAKTAEANETLQTDYRAALRLEFRDYLDKLETTGTLSSALSDESLTVAQTRQLDGVIDDLLTSDSLTDYRGMLDRLWDELVMPQAKGDFNRLRDYGDRRQEMDQALDQLARDHLWLDTPWKIFVPSLALAGGLHLNGKRVKQRNRAIYT